MKPISLSQFSRVVFFTGAGMSAESGVPTYRGRGGIWASGKVMMPAICRSPTQARL